jgi:hypothetical protein
MNIYLASRYSRIEEMQQVRSDLSERGHYITSRWIDGNHQISDSGLSSLAKEKMRIRLVEEDIHDILTADTIISFTEKPRSTNSRGGRHAEFGLAMGLKKHLIVVGPRENLFYCVPKVIWFPVYDILKQSFGAVESMIEELELKVTMYR